MADDIFYISTLQIVKISTDHTRKEPRAEGMDWMDICWVDDMAYSHHSMGGRKVDFVTYCKQIFLVGPFFHHSIIIILTSFDGLSLTNLLWT